MWFLSSLLLTAYGQVPLEEVTDADLVVAPYVTIRWDNGNPLVNFWAHPRWNQGMELELFVPPVWWEDEFGLRRHYTEYENGTRYYAVPPGLETPFWGLVIGGGAVCAIGPDSTGTLKAMPVGLTPLTHQKLGPIFRISLVAKTDAENLGCGVATQGI